MFLCVQDPSPENTAFAHMCLSYFIFLFLLENDTSLQLLMSNNKSELLAQWCMVLQNFQMWKELLPSSWLFCFYVWTSLGYLGTILVRWKCFHYLCIYLASFYISAFMSINKHIIYLPTHQLFTNHLSFTSIFSVCLSTCLPNETWSHDFCQRYPWTWDTSFSTSLTLSLESWTNTPCLFNALSEVTD